MTARHFHRLQATSFGHMGDQIAMGAMSLALERVVRSIAQRHPEILDRLGPHARKSFVLEATDLPFVIMLAISAGAPSVQVARAAQGLRANARIAGPFAALLGLVHGRYDGDALFFSGDLVIEGDVEAVLAFRNAIDNAEVDLLEETAALLGPFAGITRQALRNITPFIEQRTGLALTRTGSAPT